MALVYKNFILGAILCPLLWFIGSGFVNIFEYVYWGFVFPNVLWVVYWIAVSSAVADFAVNLELIRALDSKVILNNVVPDFLVIGALPSCFLVPLIIKNSVDPDDEVNNTFTRASVNLLDSFCIIALTVENIVLNRLVESCLQTAILNQALYHDLVHDIAAPSDAESGYVQQAKSAVHCALREADKRINSVSHSDLRNVKKEDLHTVIDLLGRQLSEHDDTSMTGRTRTLLRRKLIVNVLSTMLFMFYSSIYMSGDHGSYVFVLFLTILSFLNNLTSAACIKCHDDTVDKVYATEAVKLELGVGRYSGFSHVQFYATTLVSLANLVFRASVTKAHN